MDPRRDSRFADHESTAVVPDVSGVLADDDVSIHPCKSSGIEIEGSPESIEEHPPRGIPGSLW
jgi:hypothetical protein